MSTRKLGYTGYQARTQWYMNHWGRPAAVHEALMEDNATKLGVMSFARQVPQGAEGWIYATNEEPHGDPAHRLELVAYGASQAAWVTAFLVELCRYPFQHGSGLSIGHTLPVSPKPGNLWAGYLLLRPRLEPEEFNPLAIDIGIGDDWVFFAEVMGLKQDELQLAIELGGSEFTRRFVAGRMDALAIDRDRPSLLL
jgi:hypothetical protein